MRLFDTNVQELKYRVLREIVRLEHAGQLESKLATIPKTIVPGPKATMRCCIYHERAIVEERVRIAMGGDTSDSCPVEVIDIACDECPTRRFFVTDLCRGCIAHRCHAACPAGAISFENHKAVIDSNKCLECGKCMKVCPYGAINETQRPCIRGCKAGAISLDEERKARIDSEKCVGCGTCVYQCPFGAIVDKSYIIDLLRMLRESQDGKKFKVYAAIAPSIVSQFSYARIGQIVSGIKQAGFHSVVEVALGADITAAKEAKEFCEKDFMLSSCCPSFVKYVEINYPGLAENISTTASPMVEIAKLIKSTDPDAKVVFIGPCVSKKSEFRLEKTGGAVDCVITFEELQALFDGLDIDVESLSDGELDNASYYGRIFARTGGVSAALEHVVNESGGGKKVKAEVCDGLEQCRIALLKAGHGRLDANFIEGMACEGGCVGGAACLSHGPKSKSDVDNYARQALESDVRGALKVFGSLAGAPDAPRSDPQSVK
jgi:[FeFe] hydrogenase (group B1/B3)